MFRFMIKQIKEAQNRGDLLDLAIYNAQVQANTWKEDELLNRTSCLNVMSKALKWAADNNIIDHQISIGKTRASEYKKYS